MKTTSKTGVATPTVNVTVAKNRVKVYDKDSQIPTIYLTKDSEFEIEIFNPTQDIILAEIILNDKPISQAGLVLRQGERIFLERYLDVAKKFRFETYEVSNAKEVQEAIKNNGNLKVKFYREDTTPAYQPYWKDYNTPTVFGPGSGGYVWNTSTGDVIGAVAGGSSTGDAQMMNVNSSLNTTLGDSALYSSSVSFNADQMLNIEIPTPDEVKRSALDKTRTLKRKTKKSKKTETGIVSEGSHSQQSFNTSDRKFHSWPFTTVEYKLMPISTKPTTVGEISKRRYCTECGTRAKSNFKFCPSCGNKL